MPLTKSKGNMYPWVTHTHSHLGGQCPHGCTYCYVDNPRFGRPAKYKGSLRLLESEMNVDYGKGKTIFIDNCNDLFAASVPGEWIQRVLFRLRMQPDNTYVFQTKNPVRYLEFVDSLPPKCILGTTIESNLWFNQMGAAPRPFCRYAAMLCLKAHYPRLNTFITIEPVMDFDPIIFGDWIRQIGPDFINIGADSKGRLPDHVEPDVADLARFIEYMRLSRIEIRKKHNLERLIKDENEN